MKFAVLYILMANVVLAAESSNKLLFSSGSFINGKPIETRISPEFISRGGGWSFGTKLPINLGKLKEIAQSYLQEKYPKSWLLKGASFTSYEDDLGKWFVSFTFQSKTNDYAIIQCNLKGEVWPLGKVFDEFDPPNEPSKAPQ